MCENASAEEHRRSVEQKDTRPQANPTPDADGEGECAREVQQPGEVVGVVIKSPRPKSMALHALRAKFRNPTEVRMRIGKHVLKNPKSRLRKRSDEQDREEGEPFAGARDEKN